MANRPTGYGLTAQLQRKRAEKYDYEDEQDALAWMEAVINDGDLFSGVQGMKRTCEVLKDGVYLCKLMANLQPGLIKQINKPLNPFKKMENIGFFLDACKAYGLLGNDLFQTSDLYDGTNMNAVINTLHAIGRKAQTKEYDGPHLGPREASAKPREFSEDVIKDGKKVIGLQMGSNKGATQSGMNFGKTRSILD